MRFLGPGNIILYMYITYFFISVVNKQSKTQSSDFIGSEENGLLYHIFCEACTSLYIKFPLYHFRTTKYVSSLLIKI